MGGGPDALADLAAQARSHLEPIWADYQARCRPWETGPVSTGMCRFTAVFLAEILPAATGLRWEVRGGAPIAASELRDMRVPLRDGGMRDASGAWQGHYWLVSEARDLLDITADQFGHDPVIVTDGQDGRYEGNYLTRAIRRHVGAASRTPGAWIAAWPGLGPRESPRPLGP